MDIGNKSTIDRLYIFSFIAVLVLFPWSVRWCNYAMVMMVITGLWSTSWKEKIHRIRNQKEVFFFIILYILYLLGLLYTENLTLGLKSVDQKLVLVIIPLLAASSITFTDKQQKWALHAFVFSVLLMTFVCVFLKAQVIIRGEPYPQINFDPHNLSRFDALHPDAAPLWMQLSYITFGESIIGPTFFSIYLALCSVILFNYQPSSIKYAVLKYVGITWFCIIIILLSSRIGIIIFFIVGAINLFQYLSKKNFAVKHTVLATVFMVVMSALIFLFPVTWFRVVEEPILTPLTIPTNPTHWNSINLRLLEWRSGLQGIKAHGFKGTGTGGTLEVLHDYYEQVNLGDFDRYYSANNQFIEVYLEIGLAGFIALLLCFIIPFVHAVKNRNILLISVILITCLACMSNSLFERVRGLTFYVSFVSLLMFTKTKYESEPQK